MSFAPIALTMPQYDRTLYAGYWLKSYEQGGTTPLNMATDAGGLTTLAKAELDTQGFPLTAGSARFIPFIDGDYDLWLFPTEAEADANDTSNAIQLADDVNADPDSTGQLALWDTNLSYDIPEIILGSDDNYYRSLIDSNSGNNPTSSPVQWEELEWVGIWNTNITYAIGDPVFASDGHLYIARVSQSGNDPISDGVNWYGNLKRIAVTSGVNELVATDSATGVAATLSVEGEDDIGLDINTKNSEEIIKLRAVAGGVNETTLSNAAAGNDPTFTASGDDTDVGENHVMKGTGEFQVDGIAVHRSVLGTPLTTTSGNTAGFTSIPSWVKRITFNINQVSASSLATIQLQIGDSGGYESSGYNGGFFWATTSVGSGDAQALTTGIFAAGAAASDVSDGTIMLTLLNSSTNLWCWQGAIWTNGSTDTGYACSGSKALTGTLDRIQLTSNQTLDLGSVNILYEG